MFEFILSQINIVQPPAYKDMRTDFCNLIVGHIEINETRVKPFFVILVISLFRASKVYMYCLDNVDFHESNVLTGQRSHDNTCDTKRIQP